MAGTFGMVVGRGHFAGPGGGRGQGADCRVLAVATRVLGRGGFCRQEMNGGDGGQSNPKTLRRGVGAVGSSRPYPSSMPFHLNQISNLTKSQTMISNS